MTEMQALLGSVTSAAGLLIAALGVLVFVVSVVVEVVKSLPLVKRMPTDLLVLALGVGLCLGTVFAAGAYGGFPVDRYCVAGAVVAGFFVAFIAMFGWEKLSELWKRFGKPQATPKE